MRNIISVLIIILMVFGSLMNEAQAKRFGGGRSFGVSRSASSYSRAMPSQVGQAAKGNRWLGPLAGLAIGGLLASAFMHNGIASGLLTWLLIGGIGLFVWQLIRNRMSVSPQQFGGARSHTANSTYSQFTNQGPVGGAAQAVGLNAEIFVREAKVLFMRMQAAYDTKNLDDIREFTTPEVFAEIQMQIQERGNELNHTEITSLQGELLDGSIVQSGELASVRFSGEVKEAPDALPVSFTEIWHFSQNTFSKKWQVAGIQQ